MDNTSISTFDEYKSHYPNGSLNDYYAFLNKNQIKSIVNQTTYSTEDNNLKVDEKPNYKSLIIGCIAGLLGLIGYFTPWFSVPIFNVSISGNEISQISNLVGNYSQVNDGLNLVNITKYTYLIPISYILICFGSLIKSWLITILSSVLSLIYIGIILGFILYKIPEATSMSSYGLYTTILGWLIIIYNALTLKY